MKKKIKKDFKIFDLISYLNLNFNFNFKKNITIKKISNIDIADKYSLTLCTNSRYLELLKKTKASACIINKNFLKYVPSSCYPIVSTNPQIDFIKVSNLFYSDFIIDRISLNNLTDAKIKKKFKKISFGRNFICNKNVIIGKNVNIGHNVIIKENCIIGDNVNIGSNVVISNSIIENNVNICDGSVIGKKGFGFKFFNKELLRIPHTGKVIIKEGAEIGSNCNIDRGSISDTVIGKYTFLDNQIQIAHNVKIGDYCMIASQVGISGSTKVGNCVSIGGQSGISGHLIVGNNVKIGGKSGVLKNVDDDKRVMGYPAIEFREFIKKNLMK